MTHQFDDAARTGVLGHMNGDHGDDNVLIARAFGPSRDVTSAVMTDFDGDGGTWRASLATGEEVDVRAAWPGGAISERAEMRREIVALYDEACRRLGIEPRPHA
jgi:hypothetical protein